MIHKDIINNKLVILFVMDKIGAPLSLDTILEIFSVDNLLIEPLLCQNCLYELVKSGFVSKMTSSSTEPIFELTPDGQNCLSYYYNDIPQSTRDDLTEFVRNNQLTYRKKQEFNSDFYKNSDGTFTINLKILDITKPLLDIKFIVKSRIDAISIHNSWKDKAPEVYKSLFDILVVN